MWNVFIVNFNKVFAQRVYLLVDHPFSTYIKFSEKLIFLIPDTHTIRTSFLDKAMLKLNSKSFRTISACSEQYLRVGIFIGKKNHAFFELFKSKIGDAMIVNVVYVNIFQIWIVDSIVVLVFTIYRLRNCMCYLTNITMFVGD